MGGVAEEIINDDAGDENAVVIDQIKATIGREASRLRTLGKNPDLTAQMVLAEVRTTVLGVLGDLAEFVDQLDQHGGWLERQLEAVQEDHGGSRLLPDDAERFRVYVQTVMQLCDRSLEQLEPSSEQANSMRLLKAQSAELLKVIDDIELEPPDEDEEDDETEGDEGDDDEERDDDEDDDGEDDG